MDIAPPGGIVAIDYENMVQYTVPFRCPECGEHTFQTDRKPDGSGAFVEAECTNCGHALTTEEIETQQASLAPGAIEAMVAKYRGGKSDESL